MMELAKLELVLQNALLAYGEPVSKKQLRVLFTDDDKVSDDDVETALQQLTEHCKERGLCLKKVASGYHLQVSEEYAEWMQRLWEQKPQRYSRAFLETLAIIIYKQPLTRGEIEHVRGVAVSSSIVKTLIEREWVKIVGHKEVPGRPALLATTKTFLDYFNLKNLNELPPLDEIKDLVQAEEKLAEQLQLDVSEISCESSEAVEQSLSVDDELNAIEEEVNAEQANIDADGEIETEHSREQVSIETSVESSMEDGGAPESDQPSQSSPNTSS